MAASDGKQSAASGSRLVWDLPVRLFHWGLVLAVLGAFVTQTLGVQYFAYHLVCGYAVIILVMFRILWGFFGTHHARFVNFVRGPRGVLAYLRGENPAPVGHNPLGAGMVVLLLAVLGIQAGLGLFSDDEIFNAGPFASLISPHLSQTFSSVHRKLFYAIAIAIAVHVAAVLWHQWGRREDLLKPMITGRKRLSEAYSPGIASSNLGFAAVIVLVLAGILALAVSLSPALSNSI